MDPQRNLILQSCSTSSLASNNKYQFTFKQTGTKASTPLRQKNYDLFSPNNASPLRFGQVNISCKNKRNNQKHAVNFNSTMNDQQQFDYFSHHKRLMNACDFKQNISNNSPAPFMSKKSLCGNKDKEKVLPFNRFQTQPHSDPILFIDQQCVLDEENPFNSSGKINFASNGVPLQCSIKSKIQRSKANEDNRVFSNLIKKDKRHKRNQSQSSMADSEKEDMGINSLRCKNNDGKKAKYRVISKQSIEQDLYYCSKCTIALVQQGFILQKINEDQSQLKKEQKPKGSLKQLFCKQLQNAKNMLVILQRQQLQKLNQINKFYNEIIDILSEYQIEDIKIIQNYYSHTFMTIQRRIQTLNRKIVEANCEKEGLKDCMNFDSSNLLQKLDFLIHPETITQFKNNFTNLFRPNLQILRENPHPSNVSFTQNCSNSNSQLRFSFENPYKLNKQSKTQKNRQKVEKVKQQCKQKAVKIEKRDAFRDLFPQDQSPSINTDISSPTFKQF